MGNTPTEEGFNFSWANQEEARRLILVLPAPNGGHSRSGTYKLQGLMGDTPISGGKGCKHECNGISNITLVRYNAINIMNIIKIKLAHVRILPGLDLIRSYLFGALDFFIR